MVAWDGGNGSLCSKGANRGDSPKMKFTWCNKVSYQRNVDLGIDPECHECSSHWRDMSGYPRIEVNKRIWKMHRWIYLQHTGESPEVVMHLCDNRKCININHLRAGTRSENSRDMTLKGRRVFDTSNRWKNHVNKKGSRLK